MSFSETIMDNMTRMLQRIDNCIHILQLGHSETGAIQVPLYHKHNIAPQKRRAFNLIGVLFTSFGGFFSRSITTYRRNDKLL